ncbi:unnamed protein product, partial [Mesorhabditis spiculigera]
MSRLGPNFDQFVNNPAPLHEAFFQDPDDVLWMFSKRYNHLPSFLSGHHVHFAGGYSVSFEMRDRFWNQPREYPYISRDENCEEIFIRGNDQIYLLLFAAYGGFLPKALFRFIPAMQIWEHRVLNLDPECYTRNGPVERITVRAVDVKVDSKDAYLLVKIAGECSCHHLNLVDGRMEKMFNIKPEIMTIPNATPIRGAVLDGKLHFFYGVNDIPIDWVPDRLVTLDLATGEGCEIPLPGGTPPFINEGAKYTYLRKDGVWVHVQGHIGPAEPTSCALIYTLDLNAEEVRWRKSYMTSTTTTYAYDHSRDRLIYVDEVGVWECLSYPPT